MHSIGVTKVDGAGGSRRIARWKVVAAIACCGMLVALFAAVTHVLNVHRDYGVWAWSPSAGTPYIEYRHRRYVRAHSARVGWSEQDVVSTGTAPGGGQILALQPNASRVPTILVIQYPDGNIEVYGLSGGP
jgi:hypothetical protein